MKYLLIPIVLLVGCSRPLKVCVISPSMGINCTKPIAPKAAKALAQYIHGYDQAALVWTYDPKGKAEDLGKSLHEYPQVPNPPPEPSVKHHQPEVF